MCSSCVSLFVCFVYEYKSQADGEIVDGRPTVISNSQSHTTTSDCSCSSARDDDNDDNDDGGR